MERVVGMDDPDILRERLGDVDWGRRNLENYIRGHIRFSELVRQSKGHGCDMHLDDARWTASEDLEGNIKVLSVTTSVWFRYPEQERHRI
jgi:hypothetical protein